MSRMIRRGMKILNYVKEHGGTNAHAARELGYDVNTARRYVAKAKTVAQKMPTQEQIIKLAEPNGRPRQLLRAAVFDIEVTDFKSVGYQGYFVAGCILPLDSDEVQSISIGFDDEDDKRALTEYMTALCEYDILIGHNTHGFDFNWLHSRYMYHALDWPRTWLSYDTYQAARSLAIASFKGLGPLGDFFDLEGEKTSIFPKQWHDVRSRRRSEYEEAMANILYHCQQDVILNRNLFDILLPSSLSLGTNPFKITKWKVGKPLAVSAAAA